MSTDSGSGKPVIYLHIGVNKTGTSFIQHVLNANHRRLAKAGLLYPRTGCLGDAHYALSQALDFAPMPPINASLEDSALQKMRESLRAEVQRWQPRTVVLSSEMFVVPRQVELVRGFLEGYDCRILVYLRRHDGWWESVYAQAVKTVRKPPWETGFEGFYKHHSTRPNYGNYRALLDRWAQVFGRENIVVRPYERQQNQPGLIHDFFASIGHPELLELLEKEPMAVNPSPSPLAVYLIDIYQRCELKDSTVRKLVKNVLKSHPSKGKQHLLSPALRRKLVMEKMDDYAYIAREYMGRTDGRLFFEPLPDPDEPWEKPRYPNRVEVVEETVRAL